MTWFPQPTKRIFAIWAGRPAGDASSRQPSMSLAVYSLAAVLMLCLLPGGAWAQTAVRPNIVFILADDMGWGDLSLHGNKNIATPHLDALAKSGAQFDRFYVCSVCAPTRAEFLTGRYHPRGGVSGVSRGDERLNLDEVTDCRSFS